MATSWPRKTLDDMTESFEAMLPPHPSHRDILEAPQVKALTALGSNTGMVVRFLMADGSKPDYFINPVVILHLATCITLASVDGRWNLQHSQFQQDSALKPPSQTDWNNAVAVVSLTSTSLGPSVFLNLAFVDGSTRMVELSQAIAAELFGMIEMAQQTVNWWHSATLDMLPVDQLKAIH